MCSAGLYKNGQLVEHPDCKPWVEDNFWEIKRSNNAIVEEAYKQFNGTISDVCESSGSSPLVYWFYVVTCTISKKVTWLYFVLFAVKLHAYWHTIMSYKDQVLCCCCATFRLWERCSLLKTTFTKITSYALDCIFFPPSYQHFYSSDWMNEMEKNWHLKCCTNTQLFKRWNVFD